MTAVASAYRTVTLDERPENYVVAAVAFGHIREVVEVYPGTPEGATTALRRVEELREEDIRAHRAGRRTLQALAVSHVCDEHAVPYTSDGPLGHGWECGICGAFLQAG